MFRGQPSPEHDRADYNRSQAQRSQWQRDRRVSVTLRPLKYYYERDDDGRHVLDPDGKRVLTGPPQEKGVDVLCALAIVRASQEPATDLVIVASSDSDLAPALDEVRRLDSSKIETCCWYDQSRRLGFQLHPTDRETPMWNTRMPEAAFRAATDLTDYS